MLRLIAACLVAPGLLALAAPARADDRPGPDRPAAEKAGPDKPGPDKPAPPPLPADRTVKQSAAIGGRALAYQATVGTLPVRDDKGRRIGEVVFTAYTVPGAAASRPVTFAFNGGPGASSAFLNFGAIGPKRVQFGAAGDAPSDPPVARDNANSWLDFTDLVFIDPVGTGYSRSLVDEGETKKAFYAAKPDIEYLSRIVFDWLVANRRMTSPKYLIGESYGGFRVPRLAYYLQSQLGVGLAGITMVSPYLNPGALDADDNALSPLPYMMSLPSMAAANMERQGRLAGPESLGAVEAYTRGEFATDLFRGRADPQAIERLTAHVADLTGLDPALVRRLEGRVPVRTYLREVHRAEGKLGSIYDSNVTAWDPFPGAPELKTNDPILDGIMAPVTGAAVGFITDIAGWRTDARYNLLSYAVNRAWDRDNGDGSVDDLRRAVAVDPKMAVMIAHGMDDLSCPYFASRLVLDQMPGFGTGASGGARIRLALFPGGHMFYSRPASGAAFRQAALAMYRR